MVNDESLDFPHLLTCGMTPDYKTVVLRSTDGPDLRYVLLSHGLNESTIEYYDIDADSPTFHQDDRRFRFGTSPLILTIHATSQSTHQPINLELTSQSSVWNADSAPHHLEDIYMLPAHVNYYRQR